MTCGCGGLWDVVVHKDKSDLIGEGESKDGELNTAVGEEQAHAAEDQICRQADGVFDAEGMQISGSLERGVDVVEDESGCEQAEEPAAAGEEILLVTAILADVVRKQQLREQKIENCVEDDEEVGLEVPDADGGEAELPPPEMSDPEQDGGGPAQMEQRSAFATGMLDKAGEAGEQRGDAQADNDGDDDPDVEIDV